uniref:Mitotic spindle assembly checkpoint protein MAD1 n=1 Tax=Gouania willdenowi TaxID=441366 RepID=A0A8C5D3N2_GOUWI
MDIPFDISSYLCYQEVAAETSSFKMDLDDDTAVITTLKSFNSFINRPELPQRLSESSAGSGNLQSQYKRRMELLEAAEKVQSKNRYLQLDLEKKQIEMSHKKARFELEKMASDSARDLEHQVDQNQELLGRIKRLENKETEAAKNLSEQEEANRNLRKNLEGLQKKLEERDAKLNAANQTISSLKDESRELMMKIRNQDSTISAQTLETQELQEQLDLQRRCRRTQTTKRLVLQEQDIAIVKTVKSEVAKVPDLEKEVKLLRDDNAFLRESRENCSLLKEEVEGLRRKLERMEKIKEELINMELEKERVTEKLQAWENVSQSTGFNIRKPEDLSREVIQIQQKEIALKEQNYALNSRVRSMEHSQSELRLELNQQRNKTMEEQKKRETHDALVRRLQKRVLLLTKERDGMRAILESYDSELAPTEYSPQLNKRVKEAEEVLQRVQNHNVEMEVSYMHLFHRQKIEDLEAERQRLEEQNNILEMRLERHNLQGDYDPVKTRVLHFKMNPTSVAKQQRQQEVEALEEEIKHLRELVCSLQGGGCILSRFLPVICVPDLRKQIESSELKNQRLKEVFQKKIQEFRRVCYVLTGYQIDLTTENQYRLSSVFAEHMDDSLLFKKGSNGNMQLMETEFSKTLGEMVALHLHHQKSIPVFLSAVTLELFSRQTSA